MNRTPSARAWPIARTLAATIACTLGTWGCKDEPPAPQKPAPPVLAPPPLSPAPEVEIAGCAETLRTPPTCRPSGPDAVLRLWVPGSAAPTVRVEPDEAGTPTVQPHDDGGFSVVVHPGPDASALVIETAGAEPWRIAIQPLARAPRLEAVHGEAARAGDVATLAALLPRLDVLENQLPDERRVDAMKLRMLVELRLGEVRSAVEHGESALNLALEDGRVGAAIEIAQVLSYQHLLSGDEAGARWLVDVQGLYVPLDLDATRRAGWHYYRGILARHVGDLRTALLAFEDAERIARRTGDWPQELSAATQRVILLGALGRDREQRDGIARVLHVVGAQHAARCDDAQELDNVAWALLSDHGTAPPPQRVDALFESAERILIDGGECDPARYPHHAALRADIALGRGIAALGRGALAEAKRDLDRVVIEDLYPAMPPWLHYARGLLALREGRVEDALAASSAASRAAADPGASADPDPRLPWRLALLRGHANARAGRRAEALEAFLEAERIVDRLVGAVGVDQGREELAAQAQEGAAHAIDILLVDGRVDAAAELARRSRGRTFRPIGGEARAARLNGGARERFAAELEAYREQSERIAAELQDAWRLDRASRDAVLRDHAEARADMRRHLQTAYELLESTADGEPTALARPAPGELWLLFHPRADGWVAFAITQDGARAKVLEALPGADPVEASERLLVPFDAEIDAAESVQVLPVGPLLDVDFAALPWRGDALLAARDVSWKLDVAQPASVPVLAGKRALVVGDPATRLPGLGRLPQAAAEAGDVAGALRDRGFRVSLRVGDMATATAVLPEIAEVDLLHWAGHGRRGDDGWDSRLPLAGEAALDLRDVLAFAAVPPVVVLTGCDTGRTDRGAGAGGMHLAAAFVVAGARLVVAASEEVDDSLAHAFGTAFYEQGIGTPREGVDAVRRASLALRGAGQRDWSAFRAWVP